MSMPENIFCILLGNACYWFRLLELLYRFSKENKFELSLFSVSSSPTKQMFFADVWVHKIILSITQQTEWQLSAATSNVNFLCFLYTNVIKQHDFWWCNNLTSYTCPSFCQYHIGKWGKWCENCMERVIHLFIVIFTFTIHA